MFKLGGKDPLGGSAEERPFEGAAGGSLYPRNREQVLLNEGWISLLGTCCELDLETEETGNKDWKLVSV